MIVIKFGGTSVGDAAHLREAVEIVANAAERRPVVVVSALSGITNQLVAATEAAAACRLDEVARLVAAIRERHEKIALELVAQKSDFFETFIAQLDRHMDQISDILRGIGLVGEITPRAKDKIVAIGEKLSSVLFSYCLLLKTVHGVHVDSEQVVVTDENFGAARPLMNETREAARRVLLPDLERKHIAVMGGFIGRSKSGATTTLGRGGSDYSAAIVGAVLDAEEIQIWTDVDGMMTCDPRVIPTAKVIDLISYVEAAELAYFGAKVLHPKTIEPAVEKKIPIRVLNTHNVESPGTLITFEGEAKRRGPRAIAVKRNVTTINVTSNQMLGAHGFLARIFEVFDRFAISVDLVTTSEVSVSMTVDNDERLEEARDALLPIANVTIDHGQAVIAVVGRGILHDPETGASVFHALRGIPITMLSLGKSDLNLSIVVADQHVDAALQQLHRRIFEQNSEAAA